MTAPVPCPGCGKVPSYRHNVVWTMSCVDCEDGSRMPYGYGETKELAAERWNDDVEFFLDAQEEVAGV